MNIEAATITKAWVKNHKRLARVGAVPKQNILDNEFSAEFKKASDRNNVTYEKIPPNMHRCNAVERAVRTFKTHFLRDLLVSTRLSQSHNGIGCSRKPN